MENPPLTQKEKDEIDEFMNSEENYGLLCSGDDHSLESFRGEIGMQRCVDDGYMEQETFDSYKLLMTGTRYSIP